MEEIEDETDTVLAYPQRLSIDEDAWRLFAASCKGISEVQDLVALLAKRLEGILRVHYLTRALEDAIEYCGDVLDALEILYDEVPLAVNFPNGDPAPPVLTPRQVTYLAHLGPTSRPYPVWPSAEENDEAADSQPLQSAPA